MKQFFSSCSTITREQFEALMQQFVRVSAQRMQSKMWLSRPTERRKRLMKADPTLFHLIGEYEISSLFVPFVRKKNITADTKVIVIGDVHGDFQAFEAVITELGDHGYIDQNWNVRVDVTLVFLGDYSNRGGASVSVIAALMHLFINNPDNIVLLRGNHEYALTNKLFDKRHMSRKGTEDEFFGEFSLLEELKLRFVSYTYPDLLYWYDYLPQALFLGWHDQASGKQKYIQFCHGGIEIGYNPYALLHAGNQVEYEEFITFDRGKALRDLIDDNVMSKEIAERIGVVLGYIQRTATNGFESLYAPDAMIDFTQPQSSYHLRFGLQWNNFLSEQNDTIICAASTKRKNLILGSLLTKYFMGLASSKDTQLCGIVRGHQHLNEVIEELGLHGTMLDDTRSGNGMVHQWDGLVCTLAGSSSISGYQSFIVILPQYQTVRHYYKRAEQSDFSFTMHHLPAAL